MRLITVIMLLIWSTSVLATGDPNEPKLGTNTSSLSSSSADSDSRSTSHSSSTSEANVDAANQGNSTAVNGDTSAAATVEGDNIPRQAPSIGLHQQQSTAVAMKCLGVMMSQARSDDAWGGGLGICWKQRDDWAVARAEYMAAGGEYELAAKEYCSKGMHRKPFGDDRRARRAKCESAMSAMYARRENPGMSKEEYELFIQAQAASYERDIEQLKSLLNETTGVQAQK